MVYSIISNSVNRADDSAQLTSDHLSWLMMISAEHPPAHLIVNVNELKNWGQLLHSNTQTKLTTCSESLQSDTTLLRLLVDLYDDSSLWDEAAHLFWRGNDKQKTNWKSSMRPTSWLKPSVETGCWDRVGNMTPSQSDNAPTKMGKNDIQNL